MREEWRSVSGYEGLYEVSNLGTTSNSSIGHCANGRYKTAGGFIWKWANE